VEVWYCWLLTFREVGMLDAWKPEEVRDQEEGGTTRPLQGKNRERGKVHRQICWFQGGVSHGPYVTHPKHLGRKSSIHLRRRLGRNKRRRLTVDEIERRTADRKKMGADMGALHNDTWTSRKILNISFPVRKKGSHCSSQKRAHN